MFSEIREIIKDEWLQKKLMSCSGVLLKYIHGGKMGMQSKLIMLKYFNKILKAIRNPDNFTCWKWFVHFYWVHEFKDRKEVLYYLCNLNKRIIYYISLIMPISKFNSLYQIFVLKAVQSYEPNWVIWSKQIHLSECTIQKWNYCSFQIFSICLLCIFYFLFWCFLFSILVLASLFILLAFLYSLNLCCPLLFLLFYFFYKVVNIS